MLVACHVNIPPFPYSICTSSCSLSREYLPFGAFVSFTKLENRGEKTAGINRTTGMEGEKRKSKGHDAVLRGTPKRAREDDKGEETTMTVTDKEVEEFYAILRRIHVAVNYFKKGNPNNGDERSSLTWMRKAESQNSGRNIGAKGGEKEEENVEENIVGFDLNADPGTGSDPF